MESEIFELKARRCLRCGGILTSAEGLRTGYGPCCKRKMEEEAAAKRAIKGQTCLFDKEDQDGTAEAGPDDGRTV